MKKPFHRGSKNELFGFAKKMRKEPTPAEAYLWQALKNRQLGGYKFRFQHPLGISILDFYCHEKKLCVELDGGYHFDKKQKNLDDERTEILNEYNVTVIRFENFEVLENREEVLKRILLELEKM